MESIGSNELVDWSQPGGGLGQVQFLIIFIGPKPQI